MPAMKQKHTVKIDKFDGGLNTKNNPTNVAINQSPDLQNIIFDDFGAAATRNGSTPFNSVAVGSSTIDGFGTYVQADGTAEMIVATSGRVLANSGTTFNALTNGTGILTAGNKVDMHTFKNKYFISNGIDRAYKYDGTKITKWGVSAPTDTITASSSGAGVLNSEYQWLITAVNSAGAESDIGTASTAVTFTSGQATIGGIATASAVVGIDHFNLYRNKAGGTSYFLNTAIANGTSGVVDNKLDASLGVAAPTDQEPPRKFKYILSHDGRMFGAGEPDNKSYLWYSDLQQPEQFPSENFFQIASDDGMVITGLAVHYNSIVITKSDSNGRTATYRLLTQDTVGATSPTNWYIDRSPAPYGSESHRALQGFQNFLMLFNREGWFAFQNNEILSGVSRTATGGILTESQSLDIEPNVYAFETSLLDGVAGINWKNKLWYAVPSADATANDTIYQFDYLRASSDSKLGAWSKFAGLSISQFTIYNNKIYGASSGTDGIVHELDTGTNDNSAAISSYYVTPAISGKKAHESHYKTWRHVYMLVEASGVWDMTAAYFNDFDTGAGDTDIIDLDPGGSLWGTAVWGKDKWGGNVLRKVVRMDLAASTSKYLQFKFSTNTADQYFKIHEIEVAYLLKGRRD